MIAIVDYGAGNIASVVKGLRAGGSEPSIARHQGGLDGATGIVVPGVGHFAATRALDEQWRAAIRRAVARGVPLLGICLGMHWLYDGSDEAPDVEGLGLFPGRIFRLTGAVKVPHVGWNGLTIAKASPLVAGIEDGAEAYFTHAYAAPVGDAALTRTEHGVAFASTIESSNVAGMQFHPEKSGHVGIRLLTNWIKQCSASG